MNHKEHKDHEKKQKIGRAAVTHLILPLYCSSALPLFVFFVPFAVQLLSLRLRAFA